MVRMERMSLNTALEGEDVVQLNGTLSTEGERYLVEFFLKFVRVKCLGCGRWRCLRFAGTMPYCPGETFEFVHAPACRLGFQVANPTRRLTGQVMRTFFDRGFCFIRGEDGVNYFAHFTEFSAEVYRSKIFNGQTLTFIPTSTDRGPNAEQIRPMPTLPKATTQPTMVAATTRGERTAVAG